MFGHKKHTLLLSPASLPYFCLWDVQRVCHPAPVAWKIVWKDFFFKVGPRGGYLLRKLFFKAKSSWASGRAGCFSLRCVGDWNSANARARVLCGPGLGGSGWGCSSECVESHLLSPDCCGLQMHCAPFLRPTTWASRCSVASLRCSFSRIKMD